MKGLILYILYLLHFTYFTFTSLKFMYNKSKIHYSFSLSYFKIPQIRNRDYSILVEKLKEKYPDANKEMAIKKINILRTSYRRELKKQKASLKSGSGADEEYVPTLWCFDSLGFLSDQEEHVNGRSTMDEETETEEFDKKPKRKKNNQEDNLIKLAVEKLSESNNHPKESDYLAKSWSTQYDEMDESQKVFARKIVSDVLFQGCLKKLRLSHTMQIQNIFNERSSADYYNSLSLSSKTLPSKFSKVSTPLSSCASGNNTIFSDSRSQNQKIVYFIESENPDTSLNEMCQMVVRTAATEKTILRTIFPALRKTMNEILG